MQIEYMIETANSILIALNFKYYNVKWGLRI